jgi:tol-pal system protein YbgF
MMPRRWVGHGLALVLLLMPFSEVLADREQDELASRLEKVERTLNNRGLVDLLQQVEGLQQEIQRLRGEIENQSYLIEQIRGGQRDSYVDLDRRMRRLEMSAPAITGVDLMQGAAPEPPLPTLDPASGGEIAGMPAPDSTLQVEVQSPVAPVAPTAPDAGVPVPAAPAAAAEADGVIPGASVAEVAPPVPSIALRGPTVDDETSEASYRDAFSLLKAGQYDESITAFNAFLQQYPNSQYADNAQYWLGEAYYVMRQFEPAAAEYKKLITSYPDSKKQSHAMLKVAYSYHELGHSGRRIARARSSKTCARVIRERRRRA